MIMNNLLKYTLVLALFAPVPFAASAAVSRQSLFFTEAELQILRQAQQGVLDSSINAIATEAVSTTAEDGAATTEQEVQPIDRGRRILTLAGVVYQSPKDWTIWFNGERVTPRNIPENVRSLTVHSDHVRVRWFDRAENRIVNITLRPHQHYNLDLDTISPGT